MKTVEFVFEIIWPLVHDRNFYVFWFWFDTKTHNGRYFRAAYVTRWNQILKKKNNNCEKKFQLQYQNWNLVLVLDIKTCCLLCISGLNWPDKEGIKFPKANGVAKVLLSDLYIGVWMDKFYGEKQSGFARRAIPYQKLETPLSTSP